MHAKTERCHRAAGTARRRNVGSPHAAISYHLLRGVWHLALARTGRRVRPQCLLLQYVKKRMHDIDDPCPQGDDE